MRITSFFACLTLSVSLAACGSSPDPSFQEPTVDPSNTTASASADSEQGVIAAENRSATTSSKKTEETTTTEAPPTPMPTPQSPTTDTEVGPDINPLEENSEKEVTELPAPPDHTAWNTLLQEFVSSSGEVNYQGLKGAADRVEAYLSSLANNTPQADWGRREAMAYWINTYNAFTVKLILDNYPVNSIRDIDGGNPWDRKWINLDGVTYSLNQIEHEILRPRYGDARIHFAVNCAAKSCPPLHNQAFTASNLNSSLDRLTRRFINDPNQNTVSEQALELSKIFDWYGDDFDTLTEYIDQYTDFEVASDASISFKEYDWRLNGR